MSGAYAQELTKVSVAKASLAVGFTQTSEACLESLADVMRQYIQTTSSHIKDIAEGSGRVAPGVQDLVSIVDRHALKDFMNGNNKRPPWREAFPLAIEPFPIATRDAQHTVLGEQVRGDHVPLHLPLYPPVHTYKPTENVKKSKKRSSDEVASSLPADERKRKLLESKKIQNSLIRLEQGMTEACNQHSCTTEAPTVRDG